MGGDEPDRTGSVGRRGGGGGLGPRVRSSGKGGGERSKTNGDRGALEESRGVERKFNSDEAAAMMREEWKRTMDLLRGPEDRKDRTGSMHFPEVSRPDFMYSFFLFLLGKNVHWSVEEVTRHGLPKEEAQGRLIFSACSTQR
mmetsp:Transcript_1763/g.6597  ORF Transcript_1763/g.6597 Transcript_1763/m.6597 type:complete len:142 (+) Transcript_1763:2839-3264(+)